MRDKNLVRIGGFSALLYVALSVVGNVMHTPLPRDPAEMLNTIAHSGPWVVAHIVLTSTYFVVVPMLIGITASFREETTVAGIVTPFGKVPNLIRIVVPLVLVCAAIGIVQISTHLTIFHTLAMKYLAATEAAVKDNIILIYQVMWPFNVALEFAHLFVIYLVILAISIALFREEIYPKWVAWLGIVGGVVAETGLIWGEIILGGSGVTGSLIFGVSLLPMMVWILAVAIVLIRRTR
ncbi:hypothetical protein L0337_15890 [candidate division KSB1 bacterium]|nr:hypothetical protein [candidate division KSB1 bacterium]